MRTIEEVIDHLRRKKANLKGQNDELKSYTFDEVYQIIYDNEIRIKVIEEILEEI